ncbi:hypothetical protein P7K49_012861 [Saguinus oedipus]|uniref:Uncharacterized protein n=1 Tax=Saguinus oedipus TaxID=9490 RepID=A0ABQ9VE96_SAGOE|nr:hypothetical protein P7K49_012861 [Saguinus oedipus]
MAAVLVFVLKQFLIGSGPRDTFHVPREVEAQEQVFAPPGPAQPASTWSSGQAVRGTPKASTAGSGPQDVEPGMRCGVPASEALQPVPGTSVAGTLVRTLSYVTPWVWAAGVSRKAPGRREAATDEEGRGGSGDRLSQWE